MPLKSMTIMNKDEVWAQGHFRFKLYGSGFRVLGLGVQGEKDKEASDVDCRHIWSFGWPG